MGSEWLANMRGANLSDEALQRIPYPKTELTTHVTIKTIQAGGLLGMLIFAPVATSLKKETRNMATLKTKMTRFGRNGVIFGVVMGPLLTFMKIRSEEDPYKVWDRCYRLRNNRGQVRVDQASILGAAGGAAVGAVSGGGALFGGLLGMVSGVLGAAIYNGAADKK